MNDLARLNLQLWNHCSSGGQQARDMSWLSWPVFPVIMRFEDTDIATWHSLKVTQDPAIPPAVFQGFPFYRWQEIAEQARAMSGQNNKLNLWMDNRLQALQMGFQPVTFESAGLAAFLAVLGYLIEPKAMRGVAATGVLSPVLHPRVPAKVRAVGFIREKLRMLIAEAPCLGITRILYPAEDAGKLKDFSTPDNVEMIPVTDTLDAARKVFGRDVNFHTLSMRETVRVLEATRFVDPYDEKRQTMVMDTARDVLKRMETQPLDLGPLEEVITRTVLGHYHIHQGEAQQARRVLASALDSAKRLWKARDPWLDSTRYARLLNVKAVLQNDILDLDGALSSCNQAIRVMRRRGEEYMHTTGTRVQVLTRKAAVQHAMGNPEWQKTAGMAVRWGKKVLQISHTPVRHMVYLANAMGVRGKFRDADKLLNEIRQHKDSDKRFWLLSMANLRFRESRFQDWLETCAESFDTPFESLNRKWPDVGLQMAAIIALHATGERARAEQISDLLDTPVLPDSLRLLYGLALAASLEFSPDPKTAQTASEILNGLLFKKCRLRALVSHLTSPDPAIVTRAAHALGMALVW